MIVDANTVKPTAQDYFENLSESSDFNWKKIYFLIRNTTLDTKPCISSIKFYIILCMYTKRFLNLEK